MTERKSIAVPSAILVAPAANKRMIMLTAIPAVCIKGPLDLTIISSACSSFCIFPEIVAWLYDDISKYYVDSFLVEPTVAREILCPNSFD